MANVPKPPLRVLEISKQYLLDPKQFEMGAQFAEGGAGTLHQGTLRDPKLVKAYGFENVAVKQLKRTIRLGDSSFKH